jgi:hypothetical protein
MFSSYLWFLGENSLRVPLYDPETKGCADGLQPSGVNRNQGAESTLAYLISHLAVLQALQHDQQLPDLKNSTVWYINESCHFIAVAWRTPPQHYGPWEQIASNIAEGLVDLGIDVTLFATGDSITSGKLDSIAPVGYEEDRTLDAKVLECLHISNLMEKANEFDVIHNHFDFLPLTYANLIETPILTTIHGFSSPKIIPVYKKYNSVSIMFPLAMRIGAQRLIIWLRYIMA